MCDCGFSHTDLQALKRMETTLIASSGPQHFHPG